MNTLTVTLTAEQCRNVRRALSHYACHMTRAALTTDAERAALADEFQRFALEALAEGQRAQAHAADVLWTTFSNVRD